MAAGPSLRPIHSRSLVLLKGIGGYWWTCIATAPKWWNIGMGRGRVAGRIVVEVGNPLIPNNLADERAAAGFDTPDDLAVQAGIDPAWYSQIEVGRVLPTRAELESILDALGGIPASRLYLLSWRQIIGIDGVAAAAHRPGTMFRNWADHGRMLMSRDELTWFDRRPRSAPGADVYVNMSCSVQVTPHLLLDTVSVLDALGVRFVAAAGPAAACCGKPFGSIGRPAVAERLRLTRLERSLGWGATVHVNWCTACQQTTTAAAARRLMTDGVRHPVREVQVITFLEERVRELGDAMPWRKRVRRRVLAESHSWSPVHLQAQTAMARLLAMVPGVEVVDLYDGFSEDSPCTASAREPGSPQPEWTRRPQTAESIRAHRSRLADYATSRGADTVSCVHQSCHQKWSRYASDRLAVRHAVSILAEALDCAHPDRYQDAVRLGNPQQFLERSRPVWQSWGLSEERATELAAAICDPRFADTGPQCCGRSTCAASSSLPPGTQLKQRRGARH
ncbi:MAG TPA: helix-turn-helix transcriptional regulator [Actinophytocola sp.]|uniref:helix-turn-helix transcriptional regulator n=1 Tax=Actinophytocola sp. TaxID=1872138 RepID=UPI002DBDE27E|nr:helix-turn-helix transcriptional regulator [Actinophytocola sp.]HEU5473328.1 helix-turn-helix transcriptional regulator [Actinophytocola sp.]